MNILNFKRDFEPSFRLWHWLLVFTIFGLLATGLLRQTYLNSGKNGKIIATKLLEQNITVDDKSAKNIAKAIRDPMWQWHNYFGFGLLAVTIFGMYVRQLHKESCPIKKSKSAMELLNNSASEIDRKRIKEFVAIKLSHFLFFILLIVMICSGYTLLFKEQIGVTKEIANFTKEIHEFGLWLVLTFVVLHIAGVVRKEITTEHGLISSIIGGK